MKGRVAEALGGRGDLLPLWFTTMLQYSLVSTVSDNYDDFGVIGSAAMMMVTRNNGIELSQEAAREALMPMRSLPPHPEVAAALDRGPTNLFPAVASLFCKEAETALTNRKRAAVARLGFH
jgi:2-haloacid dehalogenase